MEDRRAGSRWSDGEARGSPVAEGRPSLVLAVLLAGGVVACAGGPASGAPASGRGATDSLTVVIDNRNYLDLTVRLYSDGRQVARHLVVGNTVDTVRVGRDRFLGGNWFRAVLSPVGRRRDYALPRELLPEDADLILIDVSEHLP